MGEKTEEEGICRHTRLTIPECCCRPCLEAQIRAHNASAPAPEPQAASGIRGRRAA